MTVCTLGGLALLATQPIVWQQVIGVRPATAVFEAQPEVVAVLLDQRGPYTLKIQRDGKPDREIKGLWALVEEAADDPFLARVRVADRRWMWEYGHILRRYNIRRAAGFFRTSATDVAELNEVNQLQQFAAYSVKSITDAGRVVGQERWIALDVIKDVIRQAVDAEAAFSVIAGVGGAGGANLAVDYDFPEGEPNIPVIDLVIDDQADTAVARVLDYMPGINVTVDDDGTLVVFDRTDAREFDLLPNPDPMQPPGPEIVNGGHSRGIDYRNEAPSEIHVLYTMEVELRLDFSAATQRANTGEQNEDGRFLYNVLPQPDYQMEDLQTGALNPQGTYTDVDAYLDNNAVETAPWGGSLTDLHIRQGLMPFSDIFPAFVGVGKLIVDVDWAARGEAFQQHYYQTFRVASQLHDRVLSWRGYRVGTVNQATGRRAPSVAYGGYYRLGSDRSLYRDYASGDDEAGRVLHHGFNVPGYADTIGAESFPMPNRVIFTDPEQAILHLVFVPDPHRVFQQALPAQIETDSMPKWSRPGHIAEVQGVVHPVCFDCLTDPADALPRLEADHKVSVIVTAVPAAPNDRRQLYRVVIKPEDLTNVIPSQVREAASKARGPIKEIRIPASVEVARIRWLDARSGEIEKIFGIGESGEVDPLGDVLKALFLPELCVNASADTGLQPTRAATPGAQHIGAPLDEIAAAHAAAIWATYVDHPVGSSTYDMQSLAIRGWTSAITDILSPDGQANTVVEFEDRIPKLDPNALLSRQVAAQIMREVP